MSHATAGLLATIPVLGMGLFALPGARLAARWGTKRAIGGCLGLIAAAGLLRAFAPGATLLLLGTAAIGIGMGACGALLPVAVKERFVRRPGLATGAYTTGIQVGAVSSSLVVVALSANGDWRLALVVLSLSAAAVCVGWLVLDDEGGASPPRAAGRAELAAVLRTPVTWALIAAFALMGTVYYGLIAWMPDAYEEKGWSATSAGGLIAALSFAQVPGALAGAWLGDRVAERRRLLAAAAVVLALGAAGVAALPDAAYLWATLAGLGMGVLFTVVLTLPLDLGAHPTQAGAIAGVMLSGGYTAAALAPVLLGAVRDATGSYGGVLLAVAVAAVVLVAICLLVPKGSGRPTAAPYLGHLG
jgi:CP family cyanate transporter-like MFS transporter